MSKAPQKRDPKLNPLHGSPVIYKDSSTAKAPQKEITEKLSSTRYLPCTRCMGEGGMGGGCPKCGGTGYSD